MAAKKRPYNWHTKIKAALRKIWLYSPERRAVLQQAKAPVPYSVVCSLCRAVVHQKLAAVDHITPIVPIDGHDSWDALIDRIQHSPQAVLCLSCHKAKTKAENDQRKALRNKEKSNGNKAKKPPKKQA